MKDHHRPRDLYTEKDTVWFLWHACQKNAYLNLIMKKHQKTKIKRCSAKQPQVLQSVNVGKDFF